MRIPSRVRLLLAGYPELTTVLAAAVLGLSLQPPLAWLAGHQGINILLAVLVFATAVTIDPAALRRLTRTWPSLLAVLAAGITNGRPVRQMARHSVQRGRPCARSLPTATTGRVTVDRLQPRREDGRVSAGEQAVQFGDGEEVDEQALLGPTR